jgi:hypothetical protein
MSFWRLADAVFPYIHLAFVGGKLKSSEPTAEDVDGWHPLLTNGADVDEKVEIARGVFTADAERITHLETKLDGQRTILTAISPVTTIAIGAGLGDHNVAAVILGGIAAVHLVLAFFVALHGSAAAPWYELTTDTYREVLTGTRRPGPAVAAIELAATDANRTRGIWLNNWLTCAQNSVIWAVVTTSAALVLLLPSHLPAT